MPRPDNVWSSKSEVARGEVAPGDVVGAACVLECPEEGGGALPAAEQQRVAMRLEVRSDNNAAIALYQRLGYRPVVDMANLAVEPVSPG